MPLEGIEIFNSNIRFTRSFSDTIHYTNSLSRIVYGINACKLSQPKNCPIFGLINIKLNEYNRGFEKWQKVIKPIIEKFRGIAIHEPIYIIVNKR